MNIITMDYSKMKVSELKSLCKERNIKGFSGKTKPELIELLSLPIQPSKKNKKNSKITTSTCGQLYSRSFTGIISKIQR